MLGLEVMSNTYGFRFTRPVLARMAALLILPATLLVACSDDGTAPTEAPATSTPEASAPPAEEGRMVQSGDTVSVHYRGTLDDGEEFDSSAGRDPLTFTVGAGAVISGFDDAVTGMEVGEKKTFRLEPEAAYGQVEDELIVTVEAANAPPGLEVGQQVALGANTPAVVVAVAENGDVTVDANHPLAGEALTFEIELVSIQ